MIVQIGQTDIPGPDGQPVPHKVIQALDPDTGFPVAQIAIPIGEQSVAIGKVIAGEEPGRASDLIVPDSPPPPSDLRG